MSASPAQFERVARDLFSSAAITCWCRVSSGTVTPDPLLHRTRTIACRVLYDAVAEYVAMAGLGEHVTISRGFSLGGLLTAWTAQHFPIERAVPIAPFFGVSWIPNRLSGSGRRAAARRRRIASTGGIPFCANVSFLRPTVTRGMQRMRSRTRIGSRGRCLTKRVRAAGCRTRDDRSMPPRSPSITMRFASSTKTGAVSDPKAGARLPCLPAYHSRCRWLQLRISKVDE